MRMTLQSSALKSPFGIKRRDKQIRPIGKSYQETLTRVTFAICQFESAELLTCAERLPAPLPSQWKRG
jgi:hypothetical protein